MALLEIRESLDRSGTLDRGLRRDLIRTYGKLSEVLLFVGRRDEAMEQSRKLVALAEGLAAADPHNFDDQRNLASAYLDIGWKQALGGNWQAGLANARWAVALFERQLAQRPNDPGAQWRLALACERTGGILANNTGAHDDALALHRKELALTEQMIAADPLNARVRRLRAYAHFSIGNDLMVAGDATAARSQLEQALAEFEKQSAADPKNAELRLDIARGSGLVAQAAISAGKAAEAIAPLRKALAMLRDLPPSPEQAAQTATDRFRLGEAHRLIGESLGTRSRIAEALSWYRQCLPGLEEARQRGVLQGRDLEIVEQARAGIRKCEEALAIK